MGDMKNPRDAINKASWSFVDAAKDSVSTNIAAAVRSKEIEVKPEHMAKLLALVNASIEEGYHKGFRAFSKTVSAAVEATAEAAKAPAKKNI